MSTTPVTPNTIEASEHDRDEAERQAWLQEHVEPLVPAALACATMLEAKQADLGDDFTQWENIRPDWLRTRGVSETTAEHFLREREGVRLALFVRPQELRKFVHQARNLRLTDKLQHAIKPKPGEPGPTSRIAQFLLNELRRLATSENADNTIRQYRYWLDRVRRSIRNPADVPVTTMVEHRAPAPDGPSDFDAWTGRPLE